jgi:hypothetical protein
MGFAAGNGTRAAEIAGYSARSARVTASRLLAKGSIREAIEERVTADPTTADREERRRFLTTMMRNPLQRPRVRLRACDLLARASGDYVHRVQLEEPLNDDRPYDLSLLTDEELLQYEAILKKCSTHREAEFPLTPEEELAAHETLARLAGVPFAGDGEEPQG